MSLRNSYQYIKIHTDSFLVGKGEALPKLLLQMTNLQIAMPSTNIYFVPYDTNHIPNDRKRGE